MTRESQTVSRAALLEKVEKQRLLYSKLLLLMNPKETDHVMLLDKLGEVVKALGMDDKLESEVKISVWSDAVVNQAQQILKREWERVKRGT